MGATYDDLIDEETWGFIRKTGEFYPPDAVGLSIADQRRVYDEMCRAFDHGYPEGVTATDMSADGVPVRVYTAGQPTVSVVYFHGGGFVVGGLDSHDDVCAEICARTGYRVISVDYRLSPEHLPPAAFQDSWTATGWVARQFGDPMVLAGDSAGGNLAAAVTQHARGRLPGIVGQVLIYPGLGGDRDSGSYLEHANAPLLTRDEILFYEEVLRSGGVRLEDPTVSPLRDTDFSGLPPTVAFVAECDPVSDDGRTYVDRLREAGTRAHLFDEAGMVHGYLRARHTVHRARDSFERIEVAIEALGQGLWPWD